MCAAKLKEALNDCLINFDRRVLLTDLINEYHMTIEEVSQTLTTHLEKQEKEGTKYEKRYVVHGIVADEAGKEVFTIVKGETKLNEWLNKLKDAESSLYSVEITGGAKAPAENLKPVEWCAIQLENLEKRVSGGKKNDGDTVKTNATATAKAEIKIENKPSAANVFTKSKQSENKNSTSNTKDKGKDAGASISKTVAVESSKTSPNKKAPQKSVDSKKVSPKDKKAAAATSGQKNIGSFFAPKGKDAADATGKAASGVIRQKTPKKLNDFFKKQVDAKETLKHEEKKANTSTQLFTDDGDDAEEEQKAEENVEEKTVEVLVESSDEEEEINKLRKKVLDADKEEATASKRKRLRIEDSDEEESEEDVQEQPQQKQSKLDEAATEIDDSPPKSETYLDEDGFVITVKSKKTQSKATSSTAAKARPKTPKKSSPKDNKSKQTPTPAAKTKQGNIMNFFKKK
uniref:DNA polymerase delta subunit 3 n=1 Tax=Ceratitis capitata TaxID=7213 RepID=W8AZI1_CERCA